MDGAGHFSRTSSSSSAVDLGMPRSPTRYGAPSPVLDPAEGFATSQSRRRASWGRTEAVDLGTDPLHLHYGSGPPIAGGAYTMSDDPFVSADERGGYVGFESPFDAPSTSSSRGESAYPFGTRASETSLVPSYKSSSSTDDLDRDDDAVHLTKGIGSANSKGSGSSAAPWSGRMDHDTLDPERAAHAAKRRSKAYGTPSPLKKTKTQLQTVSASLRHMSLRVVNLATVGLEGHGVRLPDDEDEMEGDEHDMKKDAEEEFPDLRRQLPTRGWTLGFMGPGNPVRLAMYRFLVNPWTEPMILFLILINAVVLTIQAARTDVLPDSGNGLPLPVKGYFHTWEDYVLFILFIIFTLEAAARICVSGLLLDPDVPTSSVFRSFFSPLPSSASMSRSQSTIHRNTSFRDRFRTFRYNTARPFALAHHAHEPLPTQPMATTLPTALSVDSFRSTSTLHYAPHAIEKAVSQIHQRTASASVSHPPHVGSHPPALPGTLGQMMQSEQRAGEPLSLPFKLAVAQGQEKTMQNVPYLRHSWTRIDAVAIVSFWLSFALATGGLERGTHHIGVFRAMSVLRTARLLAVTSGTTAIMRSLKTARPLLVNVAYFVVFAMVIFSIIGVQSFSASFRRSCFINPIKGEGQVQTNNQCGGYIDPTTLDAVGFVNLNGNLTGAPKGYICPLGQTCIEQGNPDNGIESFDTMYYSLLQIIIVASTNGWSPIMYSMIQAEFFVSCFFFIVCVLVLNFWLINLVVAVITNTFSAIRSNTNKSAFGAAALAPVVEDRDEQWSTNENIPARRNWVQSVYQRIRWCWVFAALASLALQATRTVDPSPVHLQVLNVGELTITALFDIEIIIRIVAELPNWRAFFWKGTNLLDLTLVVGTTIIQIPFIRNSDVYPWLTAFQLARFYRVILEVPRMRPLLLSVFGNMYGLVNMTLFLLLINFVSALVAVQLFRGDMDSGTTMNFGQIFTAFLAMYQITSSENWTNVLYSVAPAEIPLGQAVFACILIPGWFLFANFIVLQLFIAVINENFSVAEETKKGQQATDFWAAQTSAHTPSSSWMRRLNPYRWMKAAPKAIAVESLPSNLVLPMQKSMVETQSIISDGKHVQMSEKSSTRRGPGHYSTKSLRLLQNIFTGEEISPDVPLKTLKNTRPESTVSMSNLPEDETERHLEILAAFNTEVETRDDINEEIYERRAQKADFIRAHPSYDKTFWLFSQKNKIRQFCQRVVRPAGGERIFGQAPSNIAHPVFQLVLLLAVIGGIIVEGIATPVYRRIYFNEFGLTRFAWFENAETVFGLTLFVEFCIKIVADGFLFTPNAYIRDIWNILDFVIMIGLLVNTITGLIFIGGLSRLTRSLKALRALRLITLIDKMRSTFQSLIFAGAVRIWDAALLAMLYMIPYAVWGLNIFNGLMKQCNDSSVANLSQCRNEYSTSAYGNSFTYLVPRVWSDPSPSTTFSFDSFSDSLLILFEIVSLEGWIDVMSFAISITGEGLQPQTNASQVNAIFFLIYNLMGAVVILTLFVSIIISNFSSKTGIALLTQPQKEWIDLRKLITRQRPSRRPKRRPSASIRAWCFDRAVHKHGWWSRMMTAIFVLHVFALMTQTIAESGIFVDIRNYFFLGVTLIYVLDILIRFYGLGWGSFKANGWNLFDVAVAGGSLITTLVTLFGTSNFGVVQLQKLFLVSIAFKLVQRTNSLNQLFKTAVSSLPNIVSLLVLWLILFFFFSILYLEVFSLTKWNSAETSNENYSTMGAALLMLAFMSTGEGWNQYMHDYAIVYPRCTNPSATDSDTDCGSVGWAFTLFIAWNILSMYIILNMFTGVVVQSFSYVFQVSGGAKSITREEMRAFKKVWAEFANQRTGYLERHRFSAFFSRLSGVFDVKIYPAQSRVSNILAAIRPGNGDTMWQSKVVDGVDVYRLSRVLDGIDYQAIRKRRAVYSRLHHEAVATHERGKGLSFTGMLLLLAHHKLIDDREALVLKDLVVRMETNKLVSDLVNLDRVRSLLRMIYHRRRFLAMRAEKARQLRMEQQDIPAIVVDHDEMPPGFSTPQISSRDITAMWDSPSLSPTRASPSNAFILEEGSPQGSMLRRGRRISDISMLSTDFRQSRDGSPTRDSASFEENPHDVLASMQSSVWGDMMQDAADDDDD